MPKCIKICITDENDDEPTETLSPEEINKLLGEIFSVFLKELAYLSVEIDKPEESENVGKT